LFLEQHIICTTYSERHKYRGKVQ